MMMEAGPGVPADHVRSTGVLAEARAGRRMQRGGGGIGTAAGGAPAATGGFADLVGALPESAPPPEQGATPARRERSGLASAGEEPTKGRAGDRTGEGMLALAVPVMVPMPAEDSPPWVAGLPQRLGGARDASESDAGQPASASENTGRIAIDPAPVFGPAERATADLAEPVSDALLAPPDLQAMTRQQPARARPGAQAATAPLAPGAMPASAMPMPLEAIPHAAVVQSSVGRGAASATAGLALSASPSVKGGIESRGPGSDGRGSGWEQSGAVPVRRATEAGAPAISNVPFSFQSGLPEGSDRDSAIALRDIATAGSEASDRGGPESFADIAVGFGEHSGLSVRLAAADADAVQRLRGEVGELEQQLRATGSDVEAIRVELRGSPMADGEGRDELAGAGSVAGDFADAGSAGRPGADAGLADRRNPDGGGSSRNLPGWPGRSGDDKARPRDTPDWHGGSLHGAGGRDGGARNGSVDRYG